MKTLFTWGMLGAVACSVVHAGQTAEVRQLCSAAEQFAAVLEQALSALQSVEGREQAEAAAETVLAVHAAKGKLLAACDAQDATGTSVGELIDTEPEVRRVLLLIPGEQFTRAVQRELAAGCHGSTRLWCALHNTRQNDTPAELDAPLSDADAATLREVEAALRMLSDMHRARENHRLPTPAQVAEFCRAVRATRPGMAAVQQHPVAAMRLSQLTVQHRRQLETFAMSGFYQQADLRKLMLEEGDNFITVLISPEFLNQLNPKKS